MPLVKDPKEVVDLYTEVRERGACMPCYCAENRRTIEAVLKATHGIGQEISVSDLPVILAFTAGYPPRGQMHWYVDIDDCVLGAQAVVQDLELLLSERSPYRNLRVMLHLDHGQPGPDDVFFKDDHWLDTFATVMYDCSHWPLEENIARVAAYVQEVQGKTLVEGAVDEIFDANPEGAEKNDVTEVAQAERFVNETGAFLIVPNLGTEHRASAADLKYHSDRAREISEAVGKILCIHGTSCIKPEEIHKLREDGIIKVNIWTGMERSGAKAVARYVLEQLGNIMAEEDMGALAADGYLGERHASEAYKQDVCKGAFKPKLDVFPEIERKRHWMVPVVEMIQRDLRAFGYEAFAG